MTHLSKLLLTVLVFSVFPVGCGIYSSGAEANRAKVKHDLTSIFYAAQQGYATTGAYPESIEDLINPVDDNGNALPGLDDYPKDPWGNDYVYEMVDGHPVASCLGRDNAAGGEGEDADVQYPAAE
jgi:hypothetical protein